jgi:hypothetical protein
MRMYIIMKVVEASFNSGVSCCLLDGTRGMITASGGALMIRVLSQSINKFSLCRKYNK